MADVLMYGSVGGVFRHACMAQHHTCVDANNPAKPMVLHAAVGPPNMCALVGSGQLMAAHEYHGGVG